MSFQKPLLTKKKVSQKFNLKELFGVSFSGRPDLREEIGQALMDVILDRTAKGKAIGGKKDLQRYSKSYSSSDTFKAHGKSGKVNMELTGRMMDSIVLKTKANEIEIVVGKGVDTLKSYNHNVGDTLPKRDFFGLHKKEVDKIKKEFKGEIKAIKKTETPTKERVDDLAALLTFSRTEEAERIIFSELGVDVGES